MDSDKQIPLCVIIGDIEGRGSPVPPQSSFTCENPIVAVKTTINDNINIIQPLVVDRRRGIIMRMLQLQIKKGEVQGKYRQGIRRPPATQYEFCSSVGSNPVDVEDAVSVLIRFTSF